MSNHETQMKMPKTWTDRLQSVGLGIICLFVLGVSGCVTEPEVKTDSAFIHDLKQE
jgi:hypothetical protein